MIKKSKLLDAIYFILPQVEPEIINKNLILSIHHSVDVINKHHMIESTDLRVKHFVSLILDAEKELNRLGSIAFEGES